MDHATLFIVLACLFGLAMTWGVGANDLANVMSTSLGSKAITIRQAIIIAVIFEFAGAFLGGKGVTETLRSGIINTDLINYDPQLLILGMLSVLLAGSTWMFVASYLGMPVSITNAIVGSIVGFGAMVLGIHAVHWKEVGIIAISWATSPILAGSVAFVLYSSIQRLIFSTHHPLLSAKRYMPLYYFLVGTCLSIIIVLNGLNHFNIMLTTVEKFLLITSSGGIVSFFGTRITNRIYALRPSARRERFNQVEKLFAALMGFTACAMVFAHGSNDVAIAVGPMALVMSIAHHPDHFSTATQFPGWIMFLGCLGVILGLVMYGRKVIATVGTSITALTPSRAFAATLSAASTVVLSTSLGIPVSATQTLVGAVLGVGLAGGIGALNLNVIRNIFLSWVVTLPAASLLTITYFYIFQGIFK